MEIKPTITKVSSVHIGRALTNFMNSIDVSETRIGEISKQSDFLDNGSSEKYIYSGHYLQAGDSVPTWLLTVADKTKMVIRTKFRPALDKSPDECINDYFKWCEDSIKQGYEVLDRVEGAMDRLDRDTVLSMISKLNKNKMVIIPFKYDSINAVVNVEAEGVLTKKNMVIKGIRWSTSIESGELLCEALFEYKSVGSIGKSRFISIMDYGTVFDIEAVALASSGSRVKVSKVIEYDQAGYIKPIELTNGITSIIIDGTFIYYKNSSGTYVIGEWVGNGLNMRYINQEDKLFKKLESYIKVASLHKRIIAPYLLVNTKVINIKVK